MINIFYYNASLKQTINPRRFKEQQKLLARLRKITKCKVVLCKRQKRFNKDDEEYYAIKGDDINLALDMLNDAWENINENGRLVIYFVRINLIVGQRLLLVSPDRD